MITRVLFLALAEGGIAARLRAGPAPDGGGCLPLDPAGKYRDAAEVAGAALVAAAGYRAWDLHHAAGDGPERAA